MIFISINLKIKVYTEESCIKSDCFPPIIRLVSSQAGRVKVFDLLFQKDAYALVKDCYE